MQNKLFIISFIIICFSGCSDETKQRKKRIPDQKLEEHDYFSSYLSVVNSYLPKYINDTEYILIYRIGSIEYATDVSVLCIKKKDIENMKENIVVEYFMINNVDVFSLDNPQLDEDEPKILGFKFDLKSPFTTNKVDFKKLNGWEHDNLSKYLNGRGQERMGEGHCSNVYYVSTGSNLVYTIDHTSDIMAKNIITNLFRQISPSEYFQTHSLNSICNNEPYLYLKLSSDSYRDSFKIVHDDIGKYW